MKTFVISFIVLSLSAVAGAWAQSKNTVGVLYVDRINTEGTSESLGNLVRAELEKINKFEVLDKYDMKSAVQSLSINPEECYGKSCLVQVGKAVNADKMMAGSVETYPKKISITLRLIDVSTATVERQQVKEYLVIPTEIASMIETSVKSMFDIPIDSLTYNRLTRENGLDNAINAPNVKKINTSGPRMGYTLFTGDVARILGRSKEKGGFNANPYLFQFGYQFETEYLNAGRYQALFEFIPTITGLDQSLFIPSIAVLNGLRNNVNGWEIAMGPVFKVVTVAKGVETGDGFILEKDANGGTLTTQLDSRGKPELNTGVVIGIGKTFRSGRMNIPVNGFVVPSKNHFQFGISFGFNTSK